MASMPRTALGSSDQTRCNWALGSRDRAGVCVLVCIQKDIRPERVFQLIITHPDATSVPAFGGTTVHSRTRTQPLRRNHYLLSGPQHGFHCDGRSRLNGLAEGHPRVGLVAPFGLSAFIACLLPELLLVISSWADRADASCVGVLARGTVRAIAFEGTSAQIARASSASLTR